MSDTTTPETTGKLMTRTEAWPLLVCQRCGLGEQMLVSVMTLNVDPGHPNHADRLSEHWCVSCVVGGPFHRLMFEDD